MRTAVEITKPFAGRLKIFDAGTYVVGAEISEIEAKCAVIDGKGKWTDARRAKPKAGTKRPGRKGPAPENKLGTGAPETKQPGLEEGDRGGAGAGADGGDGGTLPGIGAAGNRGQ